MKFIDYYKVLGVEENASADDIKKAYRRLARKYHPDVSREVDAEDRFKEIGEAYEVLKDPEKRAEYDQLRRYGALDDKGQFRPPPDWEPATHFYTGGLGEADVHRFSDFFESIFGRQGSMHRTYGEGGRQRSIRMRGDDIASSLALFLEEAYHGCEKQVRLQVPEIDEHGMISHRSKVLNVKIPAGVTQGQQMRLRGQGAPGLGDGEPGDLFLAIDLAPHPVFTTEGKNVFLTLPITPWEAALGATVLAPTLGGEVKVKIPRGSTTGHKLRLRGKGLPGSPAGDQIVLLQVVVPETHDPESEELYRRLGEQEANFNPRAKFGV